MDIFGIALVLYISISIMVVICLGLLAWGIFRNPGRHPHDPKHPHSRPSEPRGDVRGDGEGNGSSCPHPADRVYVVRCFDWC